MARGARISRRDSARNLSAGEVSRTGDSILISLQSDPESAKVNRVRAVHHLPAASAQDTVHHVDDEGMVQWVGVRNLEVQAGNPAAAGRSVVMDLDRILSGKREDLPELTRQAIASFDVLLVAFNNCVEAEFVSMTEMHL